jgi:hypothetical protein
MGCGVLAHIIECMGLDATADRPGEMLRNPRMYMHAPGAVYCAAAVGLYSGRSPRACMRALASSNAHVCMLRGEGGGQPMYRGRQSTRTNLVSGL